jgi:hypothetical protein
VGLDQTRVVGEVADKCSLRNTSVGLTPVAVTDRNADGAPDGDIDRDAVATS